MKITWISIASLKSPGSHDLIASTYFCVWVKGDNLFNYYRGLLGVWVKETSISCYFKNEVTYICNLYITFPFLALVIINITGIL